MAAAATKLGTRSPVKVMLVSEEGRASAGNVARTMRDFSGDLGPLVEVLGLSGVGVDGTQQLGYWVNSETSRAGVAAAGGNTLAVGDLLLTVRTFERQDCVVSCAQVRAHVFNKPDSREAVLKAMPNDRRNPRGLGARGFLNDILIVERALDLPPVPLEVVNAHLSDRYRRMGNRFPSQTLAVQDPDGLLEALFGAALAQWRTGERLNFTADQQVRLQVLADKADLGDDTEHAVNEDSLDSDGFRYYGRVCAACGDAHSWRIEFAHLVPDGRSSADRWYCGLPLCGNHHRDLDEARLVLNRDLTWSTGEGRTPAGLGVTAASFGDLLDTDLHPSRKVLDGYATQNRRK